MDASTYAVEAIVEETHWWFVVRRRLLARTIAALGLPHDAEVLDVGTSTGTNLRLLADLGFGHVRGLDSSDEAIRFCAEKGFPVVTRGDATRLPFADETFDLVLATDIIEHVDDDSAAVAEMARVLRPGGHAILTVPTFQSIWGLQDDVAHHKRRYRLGTVLALIERAKLSRRESYYFNYVLFVPIWIARRLIGLLGIRLKSEAEVNTPWLNTLCRWIFALDVRTAAVLHPPFGVSALVVARKPASAP